MPSRGSTRSSGRPGRRAHALADRAASAGRARRRRHRGARPCGQRRRGSRAKAHRRGARPRRGDRGGARLWHGARWPVDRLARPARRRGSADHGRVPPRCGRRRARCRTRRVWGAATGWVWPPGGRGSARATPDGRWRFTPAHDINACRPADQPLALPARACLRAKSEARMALSSMPAAQASSRPKAATAASRRACGPASQAGRASERLVRVRVLRTLAAASSTGRRRSG